MTAELGGNLVSMSATATQFDGWVGVDAKDCRGGEGGDEKLLAFIVAVAAVVSVMTLLSGYDSNPELKFVLDTCRWDCGNDDDDDDSSTVSKSYCSE